MKLCLSLLLSLIAYGFITSAPLKAVQEDSAINTVVIPYRPYKTDVAKNSQGKMEKVYVPIEMDVAPRINLKKGEIAVGSQKRAALNLAEGAYPVYYMPGHVNGRFQDKTIYVLQ